MRKETDEIINAAFSIPRRYNGGTMQSSGQMVISWLAIIGAAGYGFWAGGGYRRIKTQGLQGLREFWRGPWSKNKRLSVLLAILFVVALPLCLGLHLVLPRLLSGGEGDVWMP
jgi:hypothetical protein